jgi:hypothetical protein
MGGEYDLDGANLGWKEGCARALVILGDEVNDIGSAKGQPLNRDICRPGIRNG